MDLLITVILLLICLVVSNIISHYIPFIPTALTQIVFGIAIALAFNGIHLEIETEWFLLLFVAPLLYNDGRHFPREELWKMKGPIFGNAIVLVLLTTIGGGYFIHAIIPEIPLVAAFALAAILSPTDPVAVNGIAKRIHIPDKVLNLVRGESLINDASGLVAFNYAVAAVVTGYFSLKEAVYDFTYMFILGAVLGLVLSLAMTWLRFSLRKQGIQDATLHSLLQILTPFLIFIVTENLLHASGVIAVVMGGIVHSLLRERTETLLAEEQVLTENIWQTVLFILNGVVFLLLGLIIPSSMRATVENPNIGNTLAIGYVLAIGVAILAIRFVWSYFFSLYDYKVSKSQETPKPSVKNSLLVSLTGVRGAVTMAGVLSIPYVVASGQAFPERSLILFLAAGVILFTLIAATLLLPLFSKGAVEGEETDEYIDMAEARSRLLRVALQKIKAEMNDYNKTAAYQLMDEYKMLFRPMYLQQDAHRLERSEALGRMTEIQLGALKAERNYIHETMQSGGMSKEMFETFEKALDLREEGLCRTARARISFLIGSAVRDWRRATRKYRQFARLHPGQKIQVEALQAALEYLKGLTRENEQDPALQRVILQYKRVIAQLTGPGPQFSEQMEAQKEELRIQVMDAERAEIHNMYEAGSINWEQARELRRMVNQVESVTLIEHAE
ncbi:Na+/H+ antiporter [Paenibacillus sp. FSL R5-0527]|uniref:Na+/H+ antiporter n=1 Tax=Paenibacillus TaxID=44249 RepID=UPI00097A0B2D|nr:Na+/H+ antiporter [Paenibacillus macerans]MED4956155.1 Na+/H+ antiporter [Paenibacillus macerans]OMG49711.1 Na+/H+ antiporter [Paenibacillus macerans]